MPRPRWTPTEEQRRAIEAIRKAVGEVERRRARVEDPLDKAIAAAKAAGVPVSAIAKEFGWSRVKVYRHADRGAG